MRIRLRCRQCGTRFSVRSENAGRRGRCPQPSCRRPFVVPVPESRNSRSVTTASLKKRLRSPRWAVAVVAIAVVMAAFLFGGAWQSGPNSGHGQAQAAAKDAPLDYTTQIRPFFEKYCFDCHSGEFADEGLALDEYSNVESILADRKRWEKVFDLVRVGAMPRPIRNSRPKRNGRRFRTGWITRCSLSTARRGPIRDG